MNRRRLPLLLAGALLLSGGYHDAPLAPVPGTIDVVLEPGSARIGAVLFLLQGEPVDTVESTGAFVDQAVFSGVATQVLVAGSRLEGRIARVRVPDLRHHYDIALQQLVDDSTYVLLPVEQARVFLVPSPR